MNKKIGILLFSLVLLIPSNLNSFAGAWKRSGNDWTYVDDNNNKIYNEWKKGADNEWRYIGSSGIMLTNSWADNEQYYLADDGRIVSSSWKKINDSWYYFDEKGKKISGKWLKLNSKYYYFDENGKMLKGWILDNNYYISNDGTMVTGWKSLHSYDDGDFNIKSKGPYDMDDLDKKWFYFGTNGKKYAADSDSSNGYAEKKINGKKYVFNEKGEMCTGWINLENSNSGIKGYKYYNEDGSTRVGWYSVEVPEQLSSNYDNSVEWFYFDNKGNPRASKSSDYTMNDFVKINGKQYLFNEYGTPLSGLQKIHISENDYDIYYLGNLSECYVQKGKRTIDDADGKNLYYFSESNGKGYTGLKQGNLYYKGKIQKADDRYDIISIPRDADNYNNYLVNKSGRIMRNAKLKIDLGEIRTNSQGILISINGQAASAKSSYTIPAGPSL